MVGNEFGGQAHAHTVIQVAGNVFGDVNSAREQVVPRETPPPLAGFVDRDEFVQQLSALTTDSRKPPQIVVVTGPPGIGKSAAVRKFAHLSDARFPAGDLYVDCADHATDLSGMLASCLNGLGVADEHMPGTTAGRSKCLRTRTSRQPILVVVENATQPAQITAMLPRAPGSLLLATTSADLEHLHAEGAVFLRLDRLDEASSLELFAGVSGVRTPAARPLVRLCAGLPLAILAMAGRAAGGHEDTLADLEAELTDERRRLAALSLGGRPVVSATFTAAYERLPARARHLYRVLGLLPVLDFTADTAAVASATDAATARHLLGVLAAANLLERRPEGRFRFHELIRVHAADQAAKEAPAAGQVEWPQAEVVARVVRHYLVRAAFADRALMGVRSRVADHDRLLAGESDPFAEPDAKAAAAAWLRAERPNLVAVVRAADDTSAWQLAEALTGFYLNYRHLGDWIATGELGIQAAGRCGERRAEARLRMMLSRAHTDRGDLDRADAETRRAVDLAQNLDDLVLRASAWEFRGRYLDQADSGPQEALEAYEQAHELNVRAGEWRGVGLVLYFQGRTLARVGEHARALDLLRRAEDLLSWYGDARMTARTRIDIGAALIRLDHDAEAVTILTGCVRDLDGKHYAAQALELLAELAERAGDRTGREGCLRAARAIYASVGHPRADEITPAAP
ncbi:AAA family ATPase [Nonomuraea longicatena]|uniref:Tetratricopeptide repeat protein n=1 Tax=Nonomuraea longicatena TaxID=83682 RepID=A0ABP3ZT06_9ACTN